MDAVSMAAGAWQAELWEPDAHAPARRRIRVRRSGSEGFGFGPWAIAIGFAALAIFLAWMGYSIAAESNREGVFAVAFGVGLVVGYRLAFR